MAFEKYLFPVNEGDHVQRAELFRALVGEYIQGEQTKVAVLAAFEQHLGGQLTEGETSDLQALMNAIDGAGTLEEKRAIADDVYHVLVIATTEEVTMYDSKAKLKARLSWI